MQQKKLQRLATFWPQPIDEIMVSSHTSYAAVCFLATSSFWVMCTLMK